MGDGHTTEERENDLTNHSMNSKDLTNQKPDLSPRSQTVINKGPFSA